jgi:hypothetical protein
VNDPIDEQPDINDPELDAFIEAEDPDALPPVLVRISLDEENIKFVEEILFGFLAKVADKRPELQQFETLFGILHVFLTLGERILNQLRLDEFEPNKFEILNMLQTAKESIDDLRPTLEQVEKHKMAEGQMVQ